MTMDNVQKPAISVSPYTSRLTGKERLREKHFDCRVIAADISQSSSFKGLQVN
jgi:hypothetical protein